MVGSSTKMKPSAFHGIMGSGCSGKSTNPTGMGNKKPKAGNSSPALGNAFKIRGEIVKLHYPVGPQPLSGAYS